MAHQSTPTIADVGRAAGVSIATVSRVLNGSAPVAPETARRVQAAVAALNFTPRSAARILASRRTNTIGLLLPVISGDFFAEMLHGIESGVVESGFDLLIHSTLSGAGSSQPARRVLGEHNTDGLLVFADSLPEPELRRLHAAGLPVVLMHQSSPDGLDIPCVTVENKNGARSLVEHLIHAHGRRCIVFLRGPQGHEDSRWRELGYRQALERHGIAFNPDLIESGNFNTEDARQAMQRLLARGPIFDAVFAGDDDSASGALSALQEAGHQVPEEISLVGFDNATFARYLNPALTTMNAHVQQAGYVAAQQLVKLIRTGQADPVTLLPTEMVIRRSCGCV